MDNIGRVFGDGRLDSRQFSDVNEEEDGDNRQVKPNLDVLEVDDEYFDGSVVSGMISTRNKSDDAPIGVKTRPIGAPYGGIPSRPTPLGGPASLNRAPWMDMRSQTEPYENKNAQKSEIFQSSFAVAGNTPQQQKKFKSFANEPVIRASMRFSSKRESPEAPSSPTEAIPERKSDDVVDSSEGKRASESSALHGANTVQDLESFLGDNARAHSENIAEISEERLKLEADKVRPMRSTDATWSEPRSQKAYHSSFRNSPGIVHSPSKEKFSRKFQSLFGSFDTKRSSQATAHLASPPSAVGVRKSDADGDTTQAVVDYSLLAEVKDAFATEKVGEEQVHSKEEAKNEGESSGDKLNSLGVDLEAMLEDDEDSAKRRAMLMRAGKSYIDLDVEGRQLIEAQEKERTHEVKPRREHYSESAVEGTKESLGATELPASDATPKGKVWKWMRRPLDQKGDGQTVFSDVTMSSTVEESEKSDTFHKYLGSKFFGKMRRSKTVSNK
mmetsp:Transcript_6082/g.10799  ORF Transcript_6082/g.10799 Transcript_6082/m.10799 type:complete len:499 (-) Transcript_6082:1332-2828(-)